MPLRGVIHAAGVLKDQLLTNVDSETFKKTLAPKVKGAKNIYEIMVLPAKSLDFYMLFSSVASILGSVGQGSYAVANGYLDTFASIIRQEGIRATSINWGPWSTGMAADIDNGGIWEQVGIELIAPKEGRRIFTKIMKEEYAQVIAMPVNTQKLAQKYAHETLFGKILNAETLPKTQKSKLLTQIESASEEKKREILEKAIRQQIGDILGITKVPTSEPLQELGLDSIMAVEIKNTIESSIGKALPATMLFNYPTVESIVQYLSEDILKISLPQKVEASKEEAKTNEREKEVEEMSDEEAMELLSKRLENIEDEDEE